MPGRLVMESNAVQHNPSNMTTINPAVNGVSNSNGTTKDQQQLPPELEHWAHTYVPMGKLLERMAQQCYHDLGEVIDQMADMTISTPQANGVSNSAPDTSPQSVDKKLRLMNFAQSQKDRFIKALVLSDWARNMEDMDKMIELRMWLQQQDDASSQAADAIMRLKHNMIAAKMPNPNIQGALELLSTSKAPWVPDLGYIPPKPLTAHKLLKTLRDMNFALSIRLNLHETLPAHFCNYSISNGRATFVVPHEFELDLAVVDQESTSPFYFIDIRFLFSDAPPLADGIVRSSLEGKVNQVLELNGLSGAYDFLHGFVLTHKITLLRRQAFELARTRWTECLHIEPVHRSLIVQYWTGQPGGKSWIEIGVAKGVNPAKSQEPSSPAVHLRIRWFRGGKEVPNVPFELDPESPSMEHLLNQVTAAHIDIRLSTMRDQLQAITPPKSALAVDLQSSSTDPNSCSLNTKLGQSSTETTLRIIPVNGNVCISPVNTTSLDVEKRLNANPSIDAAQILSYLNCKLVQDQITRQAVQVGLLLLPTDKQQDLNRVFGENIIRRTTFTRPGWGDDWAIAVTISLQGIKWWIVRLANSQTGRSIHNVEALHMSSPSHFNRQTLLNIESRAVAQVSISNITSQLRDQNISHRIQHAASSPSSKTPGSSTPATALIAIRFQDLMQPSDPNLRKSWKPWCKDMAILTHHGVTEPSRGEIKVKYVLKVTLLPQIAADLAPCISKQSDAKEGIIFLPDGICALQLKTQFGAGLVDLAQSRLRRVERLSTCLRAIKKKGFSLDAAGISALVFKYQQDPPLQAGIVFADSIQAPIVFRIPPDNANNPHRRLQPMLQKYLESPSPDHALNTMEETTRFNAFLSVLTTTLPLLRAFAAIESPAVGHARVLVRTLQNFKLVYSAPSTPMLLDMQLLRRAGNDVWTFQPVKDKFTDEQFQAARAVVAKAAQGINGVLSFTSGAVSELAAVEQLLIAIDALAKKSQSGQNDAGQGHEIVVLD